MKKVSRWRSRFGVAALLVVGAAALPGGLYGQGPEGSSRPAVRQSWTADRRAFAEGDVLTVLLDDYTLATQHTGNSALSSRARDADVGVSQNVVRRPGIPTSAGGGFSSGTRGESRERGDATRENRFRGEMTVRVVGVEPGGMLKVTGTKRVQVDGGTQEVSLTGLVRPQDVSAQNVVESWRVADMDLQYRSKGSLGRPKGGILSRILGWVWP